MRLLCILVDICVLPEAEVHMAIIGSDVEFGATLRVKCDRGYQMDDGNSTTIVECGPGGMWTPNITNCSGLFSCYFNSFVSIFSTNYENKTS